MLYDSEHESQSDDYPVERVIKEIMAMKSSVIKIEDMESEDSQYEDSEEEDEEEMPCICELDCKVFQKKNRSNVKVFLMDEEEVPLIKEEIPENSSLVINMGIYHDKDRRENNRKMFHH